jgi:hypothetical protein
VDSGSRPSCMRLRIDAASLGNSLRITKSTRLPCARLGRLVLDAWYSFVSASICGVGGRDGSAMARWERGDERVGFPSREMLGPAGVC